MNGSALASTIAREDVDLGDGAPAREPFGTAGQIVAHRVLAQLRAGATVSPRRGAEEEAKLAALLAAEVDQCLELRSPPIKRRKAGKLGA